MDFSYLNVASMRAAVGVLLPFTLVATIGRFYSRSSKKVPLRTDDFFVIPASILTLGVCIAIILGIHHGGIGTRELDVVSQFESPEHESIFIGCLNAIQTMSCLAIGCIRLSLYFSYLRGRGWSLRDFSVTWGYWILIAMSALWALLYFVLYLALPPIPGSRDGYYRPDVFQIAIGYDSDGPRELFVFGLWIADAVLNFVTLCTAIPNIKFTNVSAGIALYEAGTIAIGLGALVASIMRPVTASDWLSELNSGPRWDDILATSAVMLWSLVECSLGTVAASMTMFSSPASGVGHKNSSDHSVDKSETV